MLIGYMRVSKNDGSQTTELQRDALKAAGVRTNRLYEDRASGRTDERPGLDSALKALRRGDTLLVWKLDRLGRNLRHLVNTVQDLEERGVGFRVLTGLSERTRAGLASARARGRKGGARYKMTVPKLRLAMAAMGNAATHVGNLCRELGVTRQTLYRHVAPDGTLRKDGKRLLDRK